MSSSNPTTRFSVALASGRRCGAKWGGLPIGLHRGAPLGSRIEPGFARESLANFISEGVREVVGHAVLGPGRSADQLIDE